MDSYMLACCGAIAELAHNNDDAMMMTMVMLVHEVFIGSRFDDDIAGHSRCRTARRSWNCSICRGSLVRYVY